MLKILYIKIVKVDFLKFRKFYYKKKFTCLFGYLSFTIELKEKKKMCDPNQRQFSFILYLAYKYIFIERV